MSSPDNKRMGWWPRFEHRHTQAIVGVLPLAMLATPLVVTLPLPLQVGLLAFFVAVAGLPHGALDLALLRGMGATGLRLVGALGLYLLLAGLVLASFAFFPVATLAGFLAVAAVHFGLGDTETLQGGRRVIEALARGGLSILAPAYFHPRETGDLFAQLCGQGSDAAAHQLADFLGSGLGLFGGILLVAACLVRLLGGDGAHRVANRWAAAEMMLTFAIFALWPPLSAFLLYFCGIHSVRHLADLAASRHPQEGARAFRWLLAESWLLTLVTILGGVLVWWAFQATVDAILLRIIFQGLAALTAPHMLLVYVWHARGEPMPVGLSR